MLKLVVLSCILAAAAGSLITPWSNISPLAITSPLAYTAPLLPTSNYRGPLSLAPGQPANIIAADGRPLDTLDVNLDRSAHITAQALENTGLRLLKKRSITPLIAPLGVVSPLAYTAPLTYSAPLITPSNYRGPLSLAPGQPANIIAADGRPLDTLDVNLDRSAHIIAKSLSGSGVHVLKKRSVAPVIAPLSVSRLAVASTPIVTGTSIAPVPLLAGNTIAPVPLLTGNTIAPVPLVARNSLAYSTLTPTVLSAGITGVPVSYAQSPLIQW